MQIDVFLAYAKVDKPRAEMIAKALIKEGLTVWWDPQIPPGRTWARVIEEALQSAKTVVALWTEASICSNWVLKEARYGE